MNDCLNCRYSSFFSSEITSPFSFEIMFFMKHIFAILSSVFVKCWAQWSCDSGLNPSDGTTNATNFLPDNQMLCRCKAISLP